MVMFGNTGIPCIAIKNKRRGFLRLLFLMAQVRNPACLR